MTEAQDTGKQDLSMPLERVMVIAIGLMIVLIFMLFFIFYLIHSLRGFVDKEAIFILSMAFLPVFIIGVMLHELIHGLSFVIFGKVPFKKVKFGFDNQSMSPYAHCEVPLKALVYKVSVLMPALIMGIVPSIISFVSGNIYFLAFGAIFTAAASGDFIVFWLIRKVENNALVEDHPENAGCYILE